jgi:CubicO group peptidase (beta-lactamase class C family)
VRKDQTTTHGWVSDGFEPVRDAFQDNMLHAGEVGAACTVYLKGERVVHLWGGLADRRSSMPWTEHTAVPAFSVSKGLVALCFNMLVERKVLDLDAPIATYWPAFAANGKEGITTRMLLNHRAGLTCIDTPITLNDFYPNGSVDAQLIAQHPVTPPGQEQAYAATAFGMFTQALFRELTGESLGAFLAREVVAPLGLKSLWIGLPNDAPQPATLYPSSAKRLLREIVPEALTKNSPEGRLFRRLAFVPRSLSYRAVRNPDLGRRGLELLNERRNLEVELPWMNGVTSAADLATVYGALGNGGQLGGTRLLSDDSISELCGRQSWSDRDPVVHKNLGFTQGFCKEDPDVYSPNTESFGHTGTGGSIGFADPVTGIGFGYVMNRLDWRLRSPRALRLAHAVYACLNT